MKYKFAIGFFISPSEFLLYNDYKKIRTIYNTVRVGGIDREVRVGIAHFMEGEYRIYIEGIPITVYRGDKTSASIYMSWGNWISMYNLSLERFLWAYNAKAIVIRPTGFKRGEGCLRRVLDEIDAGVYSGGRLLKPTIVQLREE
ncbi:hypothetical protein D1T48_gp18 [Thermoproteus tenax virus 1]|uniref:Uncharacterized 16.6 kDa protein n=1 Tax=Thermoproteus tenax virus 1 (strain KRA1) TaxID=10480 RepID=YORH_TTV1K|nr:hypothetical protein D1T48_gp18 [Thermoproteus tenax virus 1]P19292.1 RecName: Full=Uncharacterized 16.6 kDa protein [Thermoproteus tenax virus 1 (STRAIN KRA1)]CAA32986.1 unnamed protein product [Thermoproteus tenax virus 1]